MNYSVNIGYSATLGSTPIATPTAADLSNCPTICMNATGKSYNHSRTDQADGKSPICGCEEKGDGYYYAIYQITTSNPIPIQSVTCTSKMIFTAD